MNIGQIAKMAQQMQAQMAQAQEEAPRETLEATAGGGRFASSSPAPRRRAIEIDPDAVDPAEVEMLQDLDPDRHQRRHPPQQGAGARAHGPAIAAAWAPGHAGHGRLDPAPARDRDLIAPVARLIDELSRLPGVWPQDGPAARLSRRALRPMRHARWPRPWPPSRSRSPICSICCNITDVGVDPCAICADSRRDPSRICVVEEPLDVLAVERTGEFRGRYHVLHGAISPIDGIGPEQIKARELIERAAQGGVAEVILATNPNLEGEATAMYLADLLARHVPVVTRIARGLPVGGDLEYADDVTLIRSIQGRREVERA